MDVRHVFAPILVLLGLACGPLRAAAQAPSPADDAFAPPAAIVPGGIAGEAVVGDPAALGPSGRIVGRVTDGRGQPLGGVVVAADAFPSDADDNAFAGPATVGEDAVAPAGRTTTDADGVFALDDLPAGSIWLRAADPGGRFLGAYHPNAPAFAESTPVRLASGATVEGVVIALAAGAWITGRVRAATTATSPEPLARVQVAAFRGEDASSPFATALADADGRYAFGPLPPGAYRLRAGGPTGAWLTADGSLATAIEAAESITLLDGAAFGAADLILSTDAPSASLPAPAQRALGMSLDAPTKTTPDSFGPHAIVITS